MASIQIELLEKYMSINNNPTLRFITEDTGIQLTRVFRLFNGSEMKLGEYLKFKDRINGKLTSKSIEDIGEECDRVLGENQKIDISSYLEKKLKLQKFQLVTNSIQIAS